MKYTYITGSNMLNEFSKEYFEFVMEECTKIDGTPNFYLWAYLCGNSFNMKYFKKAK